MSSCPSRSRSNKPLSAGVAPRESVVLRRHHHVWIKVIELRDAPVAYRIESTGWGSPDNAARTSYVVRAYDNRLWWPVRDRSNGLVKSDQFIKLAERFCDRRVLSTLGVRYFTYDDMPSAESYFERNWARELLTSTFDRQIELADRAAHELAFCDGHLLASAGPPVWYAMGFSEVPHTEIGPAIPFPDPHEDWNVGEAFPLGRVDAAERGLVRDIVEDGLPGHLRFGRVDVHSKIESFASDGRSVAVDVCVRALANRLRRRLSSDNRRRTAYLAAHVPMLAEIIESGQEDMTNHLAFLKEFFRAAPSFNGSYHRELGMTANILERIELQDRPAWTDQDDVAIGALLG